MKSDTILAWKKYPEPQGTLYTQLDLIHDSSLQELFLHCEHSEGYITAEGWQYLFQEFGAEKLIQLHSNWIPGKHPMEGLLYSALLSGYNPVQNEFGDYDEDTGDFITRDGFKLKVDWEEINRYRKG